MTANPSPVRKMKSNLTNLSDDILIARTQQLVNEERELLTTILQHLQEIERRRLFAKYKCTSLFAYAVTHLKYSESQADRRISAMRLLRDLPTLEKKITSGELSLTNMVLAQTLFAKEKKAGRTMAVPEKMQVLMRLENQTTRQAEKIVCEVSPEMAARKKEFNFHHIEDDILRSKLLRLKGHFAHVAPNMNLHELMHKLCDEKLASFDKMPSTPKKDSQAEVLRQVWRRDHDQCCNCDSTYALEIDHIIPRAVGGDSSLNNLRVLCRSCNQRAAIEYFGMQKMSEKMSENISS